MTANAANVIATIMGRAYSAPTTAAAPTASIGTLTGFIDLGHIADGGFDLTPERSSKVIKDMNGDIIREVITDKKVTVEISLLETTQATLELYYGGTMVNGKIEVNPGNTGGRKSFVFDIIDGSKLVRHYVPSGEVMSIKPLSYKEGEPVEYGLSITAYKTSTSAAVTSFYSEFETQ